MIEMEFIPLKTPDGLTAGHARVRDGIVTLSMRRPMNSGALVFTDSGVGSGGTDKPLHVGGHIRAVALHAGGKLLCGGFARGSGMSEQQLHAGVAAFAEQAVPKPAAQPTPVRQAAAEQPARAQAEPSAKREHAPVPPPVEEMTDMDAVSDELPRGERVILHALDRLRADEEFSRALTEEQEEEDVKPYVFRRSAPMQQEAADAPTAEAPVPKAAQPVAAESSVQAQPAEAYDADDAARAAGSFAALMRRADKVFQKIAVSTPAEPAVGERSRLEAIPTIAMEAERRPYGNVEPFPPIGESGYGAYEKPPMAAAVERHPIENPFPHIFPSARFVSESDADGEWLTGKWERGGERMVITAVLGEYAPQPPAHLAGYTRYIRAKSGGYWVRVR